jgi:hypothetical protein
MTFKKQIVLLFISLISLGFFLAGTAIAEEEKEVKALVAVAATVPSKVCPQYSSLTANVKEVLSDDSQKVTFTVQLKDCSENQLENIPVELKSNRGAIDKINKIGPSGQILQSGDGLGVSGVTDSNGFAFFESYSSVPGGAIFNLTADDQLTVGQLNIKYLPLPFPKNIIVVVEVPKFVSESGGITILKPAEVDYSDDKLVNLTMEVRIPVWVTYILAGFLTVNSLLFLLLLLSLFKLRNIQKLEQKDIEIDEAILRKEMENSQNPNSFDQDS